MNVTSEVAVSIPVPDLEDGGLLGDFPEGKRLVGTQCRECGQHMLGQRIVCSSCMSTSVEVSALPRTGKLYTFTRIYVGNETPRAVGYVDLDDVSVRTFTELDESGEQLWPEQPVELRVDGDTWSFVPSA